MKESVKLISAISYQANYVSWQWSEGKLDLRIRLYKNWYHPRQSKEPSTTSNPQSDITSREYFEILLRILSTFTKASLNHLGEYALYVFEQVDTISGWTSTGHKNCRRSYYVIQWLGMNPHLPSSFEFSNYPRYQIWSSSVHQYRVVTPRGDFRRATLDWRRRVVCSY